MKFSKELPPEHIYKRAQKLWDVDFYKGIIFTYGDTIYAHKELPCDLVAHEMTHVKQQTLYDGGPETWWDRYFVDAEFRLDQETKAYTKQVRYLNQNELDRNRRFKMIQGIAKTLSGSIYGNIISYDKALELFINL